MLTLLSLVCAIAGGDMLSKAAAIRDRPSQRLSKQKQIKHVDNFGFFSIVVFHPWKMSIVRDFDISEHACECVTADKICAQPPPTRKVWENRGLEQ